MNEKAFMGLNEVHTFLVVWALKYGTELTKSGARGSCAITRSIERARNFAQPIGQRRNEVETLCAEGKIRPKNHEAIEPYALRRSRCHGN